MNFENPANLLLLIFLPAAIIFFIWRNRVRYANLLRLGDETLISSLMLHHKSYWNWWKSALWLTALVSLILALARPVWGQDVSTVEVEGVSVMIVLDVSKSMNAQDIVPSRLERAKLAINDLFKGLAGNELGMILFAGTAFVQFPLTLDTTSATTFLSSVSTDAITHQGTNINAALELAIDSFSELTSSQHIIILVTDGENHEEDPLPTVALAVEQGIIIHTIGYGGTEGAPIPIRDTNGLEIGYQMDQAGNLVLSKLDETPLRVIAERTGGTYQLATSGGLEISNLIDTISQADAGNLGVRTESRGIERFGIFVALALAALALDIWLPETQKDEL
jgi:Ca-activated chloride channel homolog